MISSGVPVRALRDVNGDITVSSTLPPACYTGADVLACEMSGLLRRSWLGVARADEWKEPGDYRVLDVAGASLIVVRDEERRLRVFANTCRHRGTRLLEGSGNAARIRCPFHGWTYGLDGSLRGATRMGATRGFRHADMGLVEFRAAERGGFVFVAPSAETPGIDDWLGGFAALHAPWQPETLVTTRRRELEVDCNWKLFLEVFNESYHLADVHAGTFGGIYLEPERPDEVGACVHSSFSPTAGTGGLKADEQDHVLPVMPGLSARERAGTRYTWVFPALTFGRRQRGALGLRRATARSRPLPGHPVGVLPAPDRRLCGLRGEGRTLLRAHGRGARGGHRGAGASAARHGLPLRPGRAAGRTWSAGRPLSRRGTPGAWRHDHGCRRIRDRARKELNPDTTS